MIPDAIDNINFDDEFNPPEQNFGKQNNDTIRLNNLTIGNDNKLLGGNLSLDNTAGDILEGLNAPI